ncbi:MAG TPA: endoglycoceramidase, partial [Deltaproteobacteria bacterium]|nr:endoglycoceramidase [Deltaproteobacteria bacterium]
MRKNLNLPAVVCGLFFAACSGSSSGDADGFDPSPRYITDEQGRALILHGVNVSNEAKVDPLRLPAIDESDAERIAIRYGFNLVR